MSRTPTEPSYSAPHRSAAFTLLEVLAAVAIMGIWYTVIATGALYGLRSEGENLRRIRASLVADEYLAEIESTMALAGPLPLREEEIEDEDEGLSIRITVSEFVPEGEEPVDGLEGLISGEQKGMLEFLRAIRVEVAWQEGLEEHTVERETFAFDREAWRLFVESKGTSLDAKDEEEGGEEENAGDDETAAELMDELDRESGS
jgi:prepilin-type N-terminal cleavage/methylation domain-containing protein